MNHLSPFFRHAVGRTDRHRAGRADGVAVRRLRSGHGALDVLNPAIDPKHEVLPRRDAQPTEGATDFVFHGSPPSRQDGPVGPAPWSSSTAHGFQAFLYAAAVPDKSNYRAAHSVTTYARASGLCGRPFAILIPPGAEEPERDKLCAECVALPALPADARQTEVAKRT
jgi:hypothetical protein